MSAIDFTKAVASGNDFIIIDNKDKSVFGKIKSLSDFAKDVCRRKYSVGADGLLVLEASDKADFRMRILNPDGTEVTMCGNGIRCAAVYAGERSWCASSMKIETGAGILEAELKDDSVRVKMTPPTGIRLERNVGLGKTIMDVHFINTGVPHAVHFVENIKEYPVKKMGAEIRYHKIFEPDGTNADFVEAQDDSTILVRTYERGVEDETLACGTGVVASAVISHLVNGTKEPVKAIVRSGETLKVYFKKEHNAFRDVYLEGSARIVFEGEVENV